MTQVIDRDLAALLWPPEGVRPDLAGADPALVLARVRFHGIALLLCEDDAALAGLPPAIREQVRDDGRLQVFWEHAHRQAVAGLITALDQAGCPSLLLKGTALADSVYHQPALRRRGDSDLVVQTRQLARVRAVLRAAGFVLTQDRQQFQECWSLTTAEGFVHSLDLHWQLTNVPALGRLLDVAQAFAAARPLPRLCAAAQTVDRVWLFMLGAINQRLHRLYGYFIDGERVLGGARLIWALDNHLLASTFSLVEWQALAALARQLGLASLCEEALAGAQQVQPLAVPLPVAQALAACPRDAWAERYLAGPWRPACLMADLKGCTSMADRARLVAGHLWPGEAALRERHPDLAGHSLGAARLLRLACLPRHLLGAVRA